MSLPYGLLLSAPFFLAVLSEQSRLCSEMPAGHRDLCHQSLGAVYIGENKFYISTAKVIKQEVRHEKLGVPEPYIYMYICVFIYLYFFSFILFLLGGGGFIG